MAFFPVAILRRHPGLNGKLFAGKRYNGKISTAFWIQSFNYVLCRHRQDRGELLTAVIRISIHPEYLPASEEAKESGGYRAHGTLQHDVAVLELAARVRFDRYMH